ncbi:MAG: AtpZ/AtpI family protein [Thermodesulfobacteriota bacterium]
MTIPTLHRRADSRAALGRDAARRQRREHGARSFWQSLGLAGMVGWPIALAAGGGAWLGHALDRRWQTGVHATLLFLTLGTALGGLVAWRALRGRKP